MSEYNLKVLQLVREYNMPVGAAHLCKKIDLPQATVGRILLQLEKQGFLEKFSNKGRFLTESGLDFIQQQEQLCYKLNTARSIIETAESKEKHKLHEILELRIALESLSAERACANNSPLVLGQLDAIMLEHLYDLKCGGIGSEQDLQLHLKIAQLSGNQTLYQILQLLLTQENAYTKFSIVGTHIISTQIKQHADIVEAIQAKDGQKAKQAMLVHLTQVKDDVEKYYESDFS